MSKQEDINAFLDQFPLLEELDLQNAPDQQNVVDDFFADFGRPQSTQPAGQAFNSVSPNSDAEIDRLFAAPSQSNEFAAANQQFQNLLSAVGNPTVTDSANVTEEVKFAIYCNLLQQNGNGNYAILQDGANLVTRFPLGICHSHINPDGTQLMDSTTITLTGKQTVTAEYVDGNIFYNLGELKMALDASGIDPSSIRYGVEMKSPISNAIEKKCIIGADDFTTIPSLFYPLLYYNQEKASWAVDEDLLNAMPRTRVWCQLLGSNPIDSVSRLRITPPFAPLVSAVPALRFDSTETEPTLRPTTFLSEFGTNLPFTWNETVFVDLKVDTKTINPKSLESLAEAKSANDLLKVPVDKKSTTPPLARDLVLVIDLYINRLARSAFDQKSTWQLHSLCTSMCGWLMQNLRNDRNDTSATNLSNLSYDLCMVCVAIVFWIYEKNRILKKGNQSQDSFNPCALGKQTFAEKSLLAQRYRVGPLFDRVTAFERMLFQNAYLNTQLQELAEANGDDDDGVQIAFLPNNDFFYDLVTYLYVYMIGADAPQSVFPSTVLDDMEKITRSTNRNVLPNLSTILEASNRWFQFKYELPFFYISQSALEAKSEAQRRGEVFFELRSDIKKAKNEQMAKSVETDIDKQTGTGRPSKQQKWTLCQDTFDCLDFLLRSSDLVDRIVPFKDFDLYWLPYAENRKSKSEFLANPKSTRSWFASYTSEDVLPKNEAEEIINSNKVVEQNTPTPLSLYLIFPNLQESNLTDEVRIDPSFEELPTADRSKDITQRKQDLKNQNFPFTENELVGYVQSFGGTASYRQGFTGKEKPQQPQQRPRAIYLDKLRIRVPLVTAVRVILENDTSYAPLVTPTQFFGDPKLGFLGTVSGLTTALSADNVVSSPDKTRRRRSESTPVAPIPVSESVANVTAALPPAINLLDCFTLRSIQKKNWKVSLKAALIFAFAFGKICNITPGLAAIIFTNVKVDRRSQLSLPLYLISELEKVRYGNPLSPSPNSAISTIVEYINAYLPQSSKRSRISTFVLNKDLAFNEEQRKRLRAFLRALFSYVLTGPLGFVCASLVLELITLPNETNLRIHTSRFLKDLLSKLSERTTSYYSKEVVNTVAIANIVKKFMTGGYFEDREAKQLFSERLVAIVQNIDFLRLFANVVTMVDIYDKLAEQTTLIARYDNAILDLNLNSKAIKELSPEQRVVNEMLGEQLLREFIVTISVNYPIGIRQQGNMVVLYDAVLREVKTLLRKKRSIAEHQFGYLVFKNAIETNNSDDTRRLSQYYASGSALTNIRGKLIRAGKAVDSDKLFVRPSFLRSFSTQQGKSTVQLVVQIRPFSPVTKRPIGDGFVVFDMNVALNETFRYPFDAVPNNVIERASISFDLEYRERSRQGAVELPPKVSDDSPGFIVVRNVQLTCVPVAV